MSHFIVLAVEDKLTVEQLMYPFEELEMAHNREEIRADPRSSLALKCPEGKEQEYYDEEVERRKEMLKEKTKEFEAFHVLGDEEWRKKYDIRNPSYTAQGGLDYGIEQVEKIIEMTPREYLEDYNEYDFVKGEGWGYITNLNSKYDYYSTGGRWSGFIPTKNGDANVAEIKDIDLDALKARGAHAIVFYDEGEIKWVEKGKMGWWAIVTDKKDEDKWLEEFGKIIDSLPEDATIYALDCHV